MYLKIRMPDAMDRFSFLVWSAVIWIVIKFFVIVPFNVARL